MTRVKRAFVASAALKPMARQLLQDRGPAAYAGVEKYARAHNDEAGSLAWLVAGYAHVLDRQYPAAIEPLKNARAHAGELGDYVDYYLASAYAGAGDPTHAAAALEGFQTKYPDSLLERDAMVVYAGALVSTGHEQQAIALLEAHRTPTRADLELVLGRAYSAAGQPVKAAQTLRRIYYTMPLAAEAADAELLLKPLAGVPGVPPVTFQEQKTRAELLALARRHTDAILEYRALVKQAPPEELAGVRVGLAAALYHGGRTYETQQALAGLPPMTGEPDALRLYLLLEMERPDINRVEQTLSSLRGSYPSSPWLEEALFSAANLYLLRPDYDHAAALYAEMAQRFPTGKYAPYAHWKAAWLSFRLGRNGEARWRFEKQVELYPTSNQVVPSLYWRGRIAEDEHDDARARAYYQKILDRFRHYYYADLARTRLRGLPPSTDPVADPLLDHIPALRPLAGVANTELPSDDLRAQKSLLLENGALYELAMRELQAANSNGDAPCFFFLTTLFLTTFNIYTIFLSIARRARLRPRPRLLPEDPGPLPPLLLRRPGAHAAARPSAQPDPVADPLLDHIPALRPLAAWPTPSCPPTTCARRRACCWRTARSTSWPCVSCRRPITMATRPGRWPRSRTSTRSRTATIAPCRR